VLYECRGGKTNDATGRRSDANNSGAASESMMMTKTATADGGTIARGDGREPMLTKAAL
jgi:hypothetical protein